MQEMIDFFTNMMGVTADFLMVEPIKYFTALFIGVGIIAIIKQIWEINFKR